MKKKLLTVVALIALVMVPTFAKSSDMSAGIALGTINGVGFKYNVDKDNTVGGTLDLIDLFGGNLNVEGFYLFNATEVQVDKLNFDINAGGGASLNVPLSGGAFSLSLLGMAEASYSFDSKDYPIDLLLRLEPGIGMTFSSGVTAKFVMNASVQALWRL